MFARLLLLGVTLTSGFESDFVQLRLRTQDEVILKGKGEMVIAYVDLDDLALTEPPEWKKLSLELMKRHAEKFGHGLIRRTTPSMDVRIPGTDPEEIHENAMRERGNWEKIWLMRDLLLDRNYEYVMVLDQDATFIQGKVDILEKMTNELKTAGKDMIYSVENHRNKCQLNGGVLFTKNNEWSKDFFQQFVDARKTGICSSNEQLCARYFCDQKPEASQVKFHDHVLLADGLYYNANACYLLPEEKCKPCNNGEESWCGRKDEISILHMMGAGKSNSYAIETLRQEAGSTLGMLSINRLQQDSSMSEMIEAERASLEAEMQLQEILALKKVDEELKDTTYFWTDEGLLSLNDKIVVNRTKEPAHKFGFYVHAFGQPHAQLVQLEALRKFYPDAPIYVMSDGGLDFTKACEKYKCDFVLREPQNDRWNPTPFLFRFREAAKVMDVEWMVYLEPDVKVVGPIKYVPDGAAAGLKDTWNHPFHEGTVKFVEEMGRQYSGDPTFSMTWKTAGLAGGSIYKRDVVVETFNAGDIDWKKLYYSPSQGQDGGSQSDKRIYSSDFTMNLVLTAHGYKVFAWEDVSQPDKEEFQWDHPTAFEHNHKEEYNKVPTPEEATLYEESRYQKGGFESTCQGCNFEYK